MSMLEFFFVYMTVKFLLLKRILLIIKIGGLIWLICQKKATRN